MATLSLDELATRRARYVRAQANAEFTIVCWALACVAPALGSATIVLMVLWGST